MNQRKASVLLFLMKFGCVHTFKSLKSALHATGIREVVGKIKLYKFSVCSDADEPVSSKRAARSLVSLRAKNQITARLSQIYSPSIVPAAFLCLPFI